MVTIKELRAMPDNVLQELLDSMVEVVQAAECMSEVDKNASAEYEAEHPQIMKDPEYLSERENNALFLNLLDGNVSFVNATLRLPPNPHVFGESCPLH